ncbi:MAG: hypothetical protein NZU63_12325 [Gemmataceae bacterium]|nr:hypothetical protein [Gemmataceae bacterium]MDW8241581.1 hypothetical protein [Thermogemmata sp.]
MSYPEDKAARAAWGEQAKGILYERGEEALLEHLGAMSLPPRLGGLVGEEMWKLVGYFEGNRHRKEYPTYRARGWDIGSEPTEAGCTIIGKRLK